jgi:alpha-L-rhamnosidase
LNLGGYFVDCPTRERRGYGDGQVAVEGFMSNFGSSEFYRKWIRDWRLRQRVDGKMPNVAPFAGGGGGPAWAGLLASITWRHYLYYGDKSILEENYDAIQRYVDWLEKQCKDDVLKKYGGQWDFIGDWVPPERGMDTKNWPNAEMAEMFNNCYRIYQWELLAKMAGALGKNDEVTRINDRLKVIRPAVHAAFYDATNKRYVIDEQAYYVMPLMTGVAPEAEKSAVFSNLEQNILVKNKGHLDTGMLGTYFMMEYLREIGRNDLVATMFSQTTYPSFGYMLEKGATTCWEQWNGHCSHIHSCFTGADNWFYQGAAGIIADPTGPGFKKVIIKPAIVNEVTWVKAHYDSAYGRIVSHWKREGTALTMDITIPSNTTATVYVPVKDTASVTESGKSVNMADGVKFLRMDNDQCVFEVGSGSYQFKATLPAKR